MEHNNSIRQISMTSRLNRQSLTKRIWSKKNIVSCLYIEWNKPFFKSKFINSIKIRIHYINVWNLNIKIQNITRNIIRFFLYVTKL